MNECSFINKVPHLRTADKRRDRSGDTAGVVCGHDARHGAPGATAGTARGPRFLYPRNDQSSSTAVPVRADS